MNKSPKTIKLHCSTWETYPLPLYFFFFFPNPNTYIHASCKPHCILSLLFLHCQTARHEHRWTLQVSTANSLTCKTHKWGKLASLWQNIGRGLFPLVKHERSWVTPFTSSDITEWCQMPKQGLVSLGTWSSFLLCNRLILCMYLEECAYIGVFACMHGSIFTCMHVCMCVCVLVTDSYCLSANLTLLSSPDVQLLYLLFIIIVLALTVCSTIMWWCLTTAVCFHFVLSVSFFLCLYTPLIVWHVILHSLFPLLFFFYFLVHICFPVWVF